MQEWICLIQAYSLAENYDTALEYVRKAEQLFPESAIVHIYAGDLHRSMKRYSEAFFHWKRASEMEPEWCDASYSMASCYEELGEYENASAVYDKIADDLKRRGFDAEVEYPRAMANKCREKILL